MTDEERLLAIQQQSLRITRESLTVDRETAEVQRRIRDSQFGITEELKEQFGIRSRISEQDKGSLNLSRQVSSALAESNRELRRSGQLESQIIKEKKLLAKTQQVLNDASSVLSVRSAEQLEIALAIARTTKLQNEDYSNYLATVNEVDKSLINQIVLGKIQADNINDTLALRTKEIQVQREVNKALGIAGALTDNLQRIGLRAFGGLGINLGVFEEGLADAKDQSTALAESFIGVDKIFKGLRTTDLVTELQRDPNLAPQIVAAAEAFVLTSDKAKDYKRILVEIQKENVKRENALARIGVLESQGVLDAQEIAELRQLNAELAFTGDELERLKQEQLDIAVVAAKAAKETGVFSRRIATLKKLGPGIGQALKQGIVDPFVLGLFSVQGMMTAFGDLDKAQTELQRSTGQTVSQFAQMEFSLVTQTDILKVTNALTQELGRNAMNIFPDKILHDVAEFEKLLGMSAKEAGMLGVAAQITGRSVDDIGDSIVDTVSSFNKANKSAVNQGQILKDVANASAGVSVSLGKNPEALAKAAVEARRLGLELDKLDQIASSLLDFESSIENELSAQLLTGKAINMNKARELALTNNLEGLGQEIFKNSVDIHEFGNMNRIQQEAMAKALGMSRDELAKTAYLRALDAKMTQEQAAAAAGVNLEEMKRLEVQQQLEASMQKIAQALAGPVAAFANMLESNIGLIKVLGGVILAVKAIQGIQSAIVISKAAYVGYARSAALAEGILNRQKVVGHTLSLATGAAKTGELLSQKLLNLQYLKGLGTVIATNSTQIAQRVAIVGAAAAQGLLNVLTGKGLGLVIATVIAQAALNPIKAVVGLAAAVAVAGMIYKMAKPKKIEDGKIDPKKGLVISSPKGSFQPIQTNPEDSILAGTNLEGDGSSSKNQVTPSTAMNTTVASNAQNEKLISKIEDLISAVQQGGSVYLDGEKVGSALAKGSYRNS